MVFNDIFSLANSFGTTFGLKGNPEPLNDELFCHDYILKLRVEEGFEGKPFISDEEAKEIFDLVTKAFLKGSQVWIENQELEFKFNRDELTVIQINNRKRKG